MNINLGNYLENIIKTSSYSKKELCNKLNELYTFGDKPLSYTTFSTNIKNGEISLNEAIAIATLIEDMNLNKVVLIYKNKLSQDNKNNHSLKIKNAIIDMLKDKSTIDGVIYRSENILESESGGRFDVLFVSDDCKTVSLETVILGNVETYISKKAFFSNFDEILGEYSMTTNDFNELSLKVKIEFVEREGLSALNILGEKMEVINANIRDYMNNKRVSNSKKIKYKESYNITDLAENLIRKEDLDIHKAHEFHFGVDINHYYLFLATDGYDCEFEDNDEKTVVEVARIDKEDVFNYFKKTGLADNSLENIDISQLESYFDSKVIIEAVLRLYNEKLVNWEVIDVEFGLGPSIACKYFDFNYDIEF